MRRPLRILGTLMVVGGVLTLIWVVVVWQWQDPFTALYTRWQQHRLASSYDERFARFHLLRPADDSLAAERLTIAVEAASYRRDSKRGEAIGRIKVPRLGLNMILVNGTDHDTLEKCPARDLRTRPPRSSPPRRAKAPTRRTAGIHPKRPLSGKRQVPDGRSGGELALAAGDEHERVRSRCADDHVRLLAADRLQARPVLTARPAGSDELVARRVPAQRRREARHLERRPRVGR